MGWTAEDSGFDSQQASLFSVTSRPAQGPTHSPLRWVQGAVFSGVKWQRRETDHIPPPGSEVMNGSATSPPPIRLHDMLLN
jgi:hypothetical protein